MTCERLNYSTPKTYDDTLKLFPEDNTSPSPATHHMIELQAGALTVRTTAECHVTALTSRTSTSPNEKPTSINSSLVQNELHLPSGS